MRVITCSVREAVRRWSVFSVCELNASMYAEVLGGLMEVVSLVKESSGVPIWGPLHGRSLQDTGDKSNRGRLSH